ncbi:MAG: precorrin-2 dehydrogenase [Methanothermobacter sp.]|nr:precorrin-2 dehydrogenase [Methanothermobacter sp.]MDN5374431.1 precorrin-2 dehydrogenase [Methanothermobacter sp.]
MSLTPLYIDMDGRRVLIVGSGTVGRRRAERFLKAGAEVAVIGTSEIEGTIPAREDDLEYWVDWADLVVAASPDGDLNERVTELAGGKLINRADDPSRGNVVVPATFNIGEVSVSIFTGTKSPLMARYLRKRIQEAISPQDLLMIEVQDRARRILMGEAGDHRKRRRILYEISEDPGVREMIEGGDLDGAVERAEIIIRERLGCCR